MNQKKRFKFGFVKGEKLTHGDVQNEYFKRIIRQIKLRSKVVIKVARHVFIQMTQSELENSKDKLIQKVSGVHSMKDVVAFCKNLETTYLSSDLPHWRVYVFEDFSDTQSAYLIQAHGCLYDTIIRIFKRAKYFDPSIPLPPPKE